MAFHVLVIDDDPAFRKIVEKRLGAFIPDLAVTACESLAQARDLLGEVQKEIFDLVIIDQHLPDGRGNEFLAEGWFADRAVISMSSDTSPELAGATLQSGAAYFIGKQDVGEPLFKPLVQGILDRNRLQHELEKIRLQATILDTVKTLAGTLRHEINNPLGAVLGAAYVLQRNSSAAPEQKQAAELVEASGKRIKHVLDELCKAIEMEPVTKASHKVFHIPGDAPWDEGKK